MYLILDSHILVHSTGADPEFSSGRGGIIGKSSENCDKQKKKSNKIKKREKKTGISMVEI